MLASPTPRGTRSATSVAYAAALWSGLCAAVHVYWAAGGKTGLPSDLDMRSEPLLFAVDIAAIPLFAALAWLCLCLVRPPARGLPDGMVRTGVAAAALLCFLHALPPLALASWRALVEDAPFASGERERLALLAYEPMWLAGGVLLAAALLLVRRADRRRV